MDALASKLEAFNRTIRTDPMTSMMNSPEKKAKITPQMLTWMSICGISYFLTFGLVMFLVSLTISMPVVYDDSFTYWTRCFCAFFLYFQIMLNFALVSVKHSFYDRSIDSFTGIPDPSWQKCIDCDHLMPPRTHHCTLCRRCILRRDHHCFFTGSCVGFENQRYFVVFCFYCTVGAAYATYVSVEYIYLVHMTASSGWIHFLVPLTMFEWLLGYSSFGFLFFVLMMYFCAMTAMGSAGIMVWQLFLISQGSTSFEYGKGVIKYKTNILHNFRSVFGSYWLLNFIFPMTWIKIPGNGVDWNVSKYV